MTTGLISLNRPMTVRNLIGLMPFTVLRNLLRMMLALQSY